MYFKPSATSAMLATRFLNNPARRVGRGFHCSRQDFSPRAVLESRFSPALRFSWLLRHLSVLRKTGTWLLQCRPSTPTLHHTIDTHPESGNKRAKFPDTNQYCYWVTLIIHWQISMFVHNFCNSLLLAYTVLSFQRLALLNLAVFFLPALHTESFYRRNAFEYLKMFL